MVEGLRKRKKSRRGEERDREMKERIERSKKTVIIKREMKRDIDI